MMAAGRGAHGGSSIVVLRVGYIRDERVVERPEWPGNMKYHRGHTTCALYSTWGPYITPTLLNGGQKLIVRKHVYFS
jgi:hypothetical protein